jgi:hypothetical protein
MTFRARRGGTGSKYAARGFFASPFRTFNVP